MKPKYQAHIVCPDENGGIDGEPMFNALAFSWHLIGKFCKKCGKPVAEHGLVVELVNTTQDVAVNGSK